MVGFSQTVQLGRHGRLRDNPQVVMRVTFKKKPPLTTLRAVLWRGMTFDRYLEGRWSRTASLPWAKVHRVAEKTVLQEAPESRAEALRRDIGLRRAVEYSVLLMPVIGGVLPTLHRPVAISVQGDLPRVKAQVKVTAGRVLDNPRPGKMVAYKGWSLLKQRGAKAPGRRLAAPLSREEKRAYLSLPKGLPGTFFELAKRLGAAGEGRATQVAAAMRHLSSRNGYRYSSRLKSVPRGYDPVAFFLFKAKAGHCEYFASALSLLLRAMDIPTRLVTGFVGGRWNAYGGFLSIRQGDAHAWVEAYLPSQGGWRVLDPTPPEGRVPALKKGTWTRIKLWLESLKMGYLRWVVDYDAHSQWSLASGARKWVRRRLPGGLPWGTLGYTLLGTLALAGLALLVRYLRRRGLKLWPGKGRSPGHIATVPYERLLSALARFGFSRRPGQTPREFAADLDSALLPLDLISEITELYYLARYAQGDPDSLRELVDRAVETLDGLPKKPPLEHP
jgi:protein-glutamine gamma-glutamyltransferase